MFFKNKKQNNPTFNTSIKKINHLIAKSNFDLAIKWLRELRNKEKIFFEKTNRDKKNSHLYNKRLSIISNLEYKINFVIKKEKVDNILLQIKYNISKNYYNNFLSLIESLKKEIENDKKFQYLNPLIKKYEKKFEFIKRISNTEDVSDFKNLIKKIERLLSLWKYELVEKWIKEVKEKELNDFNNLKDNHFISRRKIKKYELDYNKKILKLDKILTKLFIIKSKEEQKRKKIEIEKVYNDTKNDIKNLLKNNDLEKAKTVLEEKIKKNNDIKLLSFLNKNISIVNKKLKNKNSSNLKNKNSIEEVRQLLNKAWEKSDIEFDDLDSKFNNNIIKNFYLILKKYYLELINKINENSNKKNLDFINNILQSEWLNDTQKSTLVQNYHNWVNKSLSDFKLNWYDFYWKILGCDKITWDTFVFKNKKDKTWFAIWDATWHWIKAWFIVSKFTKFFAELSLDFDKLNYFVMELNNLLKSSLSWWHFLTSIFFELNNEDLSSINIIWLWHEPIFIYRKEKNIIEEFRPLWLAWWIRKISKIDSIKTYNINLDEWDIISSYTDWIIEAKNSSWEMYWINRYKIKFLEAIKKSSDTDKIYNFMIEDLINFTNSNNFLDDITMFFLKRNSKNDILIKSNDLDNIMKNLNFRSEDIKVNKLKWKTRQEVIDEVNKFRLKRELNIVKLKLKDFYKDWEILKLKEESLKFIKQWYVSKDINNFLKKSLEMENSYKLDLKNKKVQTKYETLNALYKRKDYKTVIKEAYDVIVKNGNI